MTTPSSLMSAAMNRLAARRSDSDAHARRHKQRRGTVRAEFHSHSLLAFRRDSVSFIQRAPKTGPRRPTIIVGEGIGESKLAGRDGLVRIRATLPLAFLARPPAANGQRFAWKNGHCSLIVDRVVTVPRFRSKNMSTDTILAALGGSESGSLRELLDVWRALSPAREMAGKIDWQKVLEFIQQIMPLILALLDLLPKKA
jgi:hypothetical protein